jgi:hypothetical protein
MEDLKKQLDVVMDGFFSFFGSAGNPMRER